LDDRGIVVTRLLERAKPLFMASKRPVWSTQPRIWIMISEVLTRPVSEDDRSPPSNNTRKNISNPPIRLQGLAFRDFLGPSPCSVNSRFSLPSYKQRRPVTPFISTGTVHGLINIHHSNSTTIRRPGLCSSSDKGQSGYLCKA
jgi:hypothetical protein